MKIMTILGTRPEIIRLSRIIEKIEHPLGHEYSSTDNVMSRPQVAELLQRHKLMVGDRFIYEEDMLA